MKRILLAIDGSESSGKAVVTVSELAPPINASVILTTVIDDLGVSYDESNSNNPRSLSNNPRSPSSNNSSPKNVRKIKKTKQQVKLENEGEKLLNKAESILEEENIETEKEILKGDPANEICDYATENNIGIIVMGDKGKGGIKELLLGSTSGKVVRHANCSVMIVK